MKIVTHSLPHPAGDGVCAVYQVSNSHGMELIYTPYHSSILSIRFPDHERRTFPMLRHYQEQVGSYLRRSPVSGSILGPISVPYTQKSTTIGKKTCPLPGQHIHTEFNAIKWTRDVSCTHDSCVIVSTNTPPSQHSSLLSTYTVEIEANQNNQVRIKYIAKNSSKIPVSLAHDIAWNISRENSIFSQHMSINAQYFSAEPLLARLKNVRDSGNDYHRKRTIHSTCEGYYKIHSTNITNAKYGFEKSVDKLNPAIMISDPHTRRYMQLYTNFPFIHIKFSRASRKAGNEIQCIPCIPLDSPEILTRRSAKHTFRCCYQFGIL